MEADVLVLMQGWSKGGGLGSTGSGITAPIEAAQFQVGAGLGSVKGSFLRFFFSLRVGEELMACEMTGVAVGKYDQTPKGYAEKLKDKARARLLEES